MPYEKHGFFALMNNVGDGRIVKLQEKEATNDGLIVNHTEGIIVEGFIGSKKSLMPIAISARHKV